MQLTPLLAVLGLAYAAAVEETRDLTNVKLAKYSILDVDSFPLTLSTADDAEELASLEDAMAFYEADYWKYVVGTPIKQSAYQLTRDNANKYVVNGMPDNVLMLGGIVCTDKELKADIKKGVCSGKAKSNATRIKNVSLKQFQYIYVPLLSTVTFGDASETTLCGDGVEDCAAAIQEKCSADADLFTTALESKKVYSKINDKNINLADLTPVTPAFEIGAVGDNTSNPNAAAALITVGEDVDLTETPILACSAALGYFIEVKSSGTLKVVLSSQYVYTDEDDKDQTAYRGPITYTLTFK